MKFLKEKRHTINEVAKMLHVHSSTVWRWKLQGVRGVKLNTIIIGGTRYVLESDLNEFLVGLNNGGVQQNEDLNSRGKVAAVQLDALGVKGERHG
ncbi:MAG: helix-turn-helix domain-containing protein [Phycisphaeraceae bacterium]